MVVKVRIYFEGDPKLRPGFQSFFGGFGFSNISLKMIACKADAIGDFMVAVKKDSDLFHFLLIDSEGPPGSNPAEKVRQHDHWDNAVGSQVTDEQIHFMVQVMESWFLADKPALGKFYGQGFMVNRLPGSPNVEQVSKADVLNGLALATTNSSKGKYHKTKHAPDLLALINATKVRGIAQYCDRLIGALEKLN